MSRKAKKVDSDGNILGDAARLAGQAALLIRLCNLWAKTVGGENHIKSIALYPPSVSRAGMWMVIGKSWSGGYRLVAFHRGSDALTTLCGFLQRAYEQKLTWKEDSFAEGNHPSGLRLGGGHD